MKDKKISLIMILATIGYVAMIAVNYLANALPIGGRTTGDASDAYANLFTPAGFTFSIWGLIYSLLAVYVVFQFIKSKQSKKTKEVIEKLNVYFIASSIANIAWIFAWHYGVIWLSLIIMLVLLTCLIKIADSLRGQSFSTLEKFAVYLPFSIYFGWITVATIANFTVFFVSINWNGFGLSEQFWTILILLVGTLTGIWRMQKDKNIPYGLVIVWAYFGILSKHLADTGYAGQYKNIIATIVICLVLLTGSVIGVYLKKRKK